MKFDLIFRIWFKLSMPFMIRVQLLKFDTWNVTTLIP
jgi:hypothetical protein